jgi:hypothetical protein
MERRPLGTATGCGGNGCPAASTWSPTPPPEVGADGRDRTDGGGQQPAGHRTGGRQRAGRWTGGQQSGWIAGPGRRTRVTGHRRGWTPDGWTAGSRTTNRLGGHRLPDTGDRRHRGVLAVSSTPPAPDRRMPAEAPTGRRRRGEPQPRTAQQHRRRGHHAATGEAWPAPRRSAAGGTPPASWRLGALLSSDDFGSSVGRRGGSHPVYGDEWEAANGCYSVQRRLAVGLA